jgi:hypothetical protein
VDPCITTDTESVDRAAPPLTVEHAAKAVPSTESRACPASEPWTNTDPRVSFTLSDVNLLDEIVKDDVVEICTIPPVLVMSDTFEEAILLIEALSTMI